MSDQHARSDRRTVDTIQRVENAAIAAAIVVAVIASGLPWWWLLAAFLLFDLSAIGYAAGPRVGARMYNAVHNYTAPAVILAAYAGLILAGWNLPWLAVVAASWGFHVAVDRALGYGLKLQDFSHTHLGRIGRERRAEPSRS